MTYNKKTINAIVEKTKALLKNDRVGSNIVMNNPPKVSTIINERGDFTIEKITFTDYRGEHVSVNPGGIYISPKDCYMFSTDSWEEFMSLDGSNMFTKDMLETGMLVTTACDKTYVVMKDTRIHQSQHGNFKLKTAGVLIEIGGDGFIRLNDYREDMKSKFCDVKKQEENIVKVSLPINYGHNKTVEEMGEEVIWQRELDAYEKQVMANLQAKDFESK